MKKLFTILAVVTSFLAIILSVLPVSNLAIIPAIASLIFGLTAFYLSKKTGEVKKIIQFSFLLTIAALTIITYKAIFSSEEVTNTDVIENTEIKLEEEAIQELEELDIEELEIDEELDIEIDESEIEGIDIEDLEKIDTKNTKIDKKAIDELEGLDIEIE